MSVPLDLVAWLVQERYLISLFYAIRQNWLLTSPAPLRRAYRPNNTSFLYSALPSPILRTHLSRTQWTHQIRSPSDTQPSRYNMYWAVSFLFFIHSARWFPHRVSILFCTLRYYRDHYSYWFFLRYCSVSSRSFLNFSNLSGFSVPAFNCFLLCFSHV